MLDFRIWAPIILPCVGGLTTLIIGLLSSRFDSLRYLRDSIATITSLASLYYLFRVFPLVSDNGVVIDYFYFITSGFLEVDMLSWFMAFLFTTLIFFASVYSIGYMKGERELSRYYALLQLLLAGMNGIAFSGDLFTFFVFWELMSVSSYILVGFRSYNWEPIEAGIKYLVMSAVGTSLILYSISLIYGLTGTLNMALISERLRSSDVDRMVLLFTFLLLIIGLGIKAAIYPLGTWLPDAHPAAPSSISAILSGVVVKTGIYPVIRFSMLFFDYDAMDYFASILLLLSVVTMVLSNVMAYAQRDVKRLLAYSTTMNIGYIFAALGVSMLPGLSTSLRVFAMTSALLHILTHALTKGLLFMATGVMIHEVGSRDTYDLKGSARSLSLSISIIVGFLSILGVPSMAGFMSKFLIVVSTFNAGQVLISALIVLNSLFSATYYLRLIQVFVFTGSEDNDSEKKIKGGTLSEKFVLIVLCLLIVLIGIYPSWFIELVERAAESSFDIERYIEVVLDTYG
ncbi:MAG: complex I subunit 5 family protein [Candidatus Asgardarchaeia archaeon]